MTAHFNFSTESSISKGSFTFPTDIDSNVTSISGKWKVYMKNGEFNNVLFEEIQMLRETEKSGETIVYSNLPFGIYIGGPEGSLCISFTTPSEYASKERAESLFSKSIVDYCDVTFKKLLECILSSYACPKSHP